MGFDVKMDWEGLPVALLEIRFSVSWMPHKWDWVQWKGKPTTCKRPISSPAVCDWSRLQTRAMHVNQVLFWDRYTIHVSREDRRTSVCALRCDDMWTRWIFSRLWSLLSARDTWDVFYRMRFYCWILRKYIWLLIKYFILKCHAVNYLNTLSCINWKI